MKTGRKRIDLQVLKNCRQPELPLMKAGFSGLNNTILVDE